MPVVHPPRLRLLRQRRRPRRPQHHQRQRTMARIPQESNLLIDSPTVSSILASDTSTSWQKDSLPPMTAFLCIYVHLIQSTPMLLLWQTEWNAWPPAYALGSTSVKKVLSTTFRIAGNQSSPDSQKIK
eukprot:PhF_6_TR36064/c0_g1_i2/m.52354